MAKKVRVVIGICFLLGAAVFGFTGQFAYILIFLVVGALYIYKGME